MNPSQKPKQDNKKKLNHMPSQGSPTAQKKMGLAIPHSCPFPVLPVVLLLDSLNLASSWFLQPTKVTTRADPSLVA
jgi:hypothetical protein